MKYRCYLDVYRDSPVNVARPHLSGPHADYSVSPAFALVLCSFIGKMIDGVKPVIVKNEATSILSFQ